MADLITFALIDSLTQGRGDVWFDPIHDACMESKPKGDGGWDITTKHRTAMFLANTLEESGRYRTLIENLRYSAAGLRRAWRSRFNEEDAVRMAGDEFAIAERAYGGRMGNGPEGSGDGYRYRGRGIIQITGKDSYAEIGGLLGWDLLGDPDQLTLPWIAAFASAAWWDTHGCSAAADDDDFEGVCKIINLGDRHSQGTPNGMPDRLAMLQEVQEAMA